MCCHYHSNPTYPHPDMHPLISEEMPHLQIKQQTVFIHLQQWLWDAATCDGYYQYLSEKFVWTQQAEPTIQWHNHHIARNQFTKTELHFLNKFIHEWLLLQASHHVNSASANLLCPSCNQYLETAGHFLQCTQTNHHNLWESLQQDIQKSCIKHNIPQPINDPYCSAGLQAVRTTSSDILAYVQLQPTLQHTSQ